MKKFFLLILFSFILNSSVYAAKPYKVKVYTSNSDFIIYKKNIAGLVHKNDREAASWRIIWSDSTNHCSSNNKKNFYITGDADTSAIAHIKYRIICANNISEAIEIQKKRASGFYPNMDNVMKQNFRINGGNKQSVSVELAKLKKKRN